MNRRYRFTTEVFSLPSARVDGAWVVYAPLEGTGLLVNRAALPLLAALEEGLDAVPDPDEAALVDTLIDLGLVNNAAPVPAPPAAAPDAPFAPTEVTLCPTTACNLACRYCYADGGSGVPQHMPWELAEAAIGLVAGNAAETGAPVVLAFHGAGEPTLAWDLVVRATERAEDLCADLGLPLNIGIATNGVVSSDRVRWLAQHVNSCMVSIDGAQAAHDCLRPRHDGSGSWDDVCRTLRALSDNGLDFGLRMTCTTDNTDAMPEAVAALLDEYGPRAVHLEPVYMCGRAPGSGVQAPEADRFVAAYERTRSIAEAAGVAMFYSGARAWTPQSVFCGVSQPSFVVTPGGVVTACYEVVREADPRAHLFHYGRYEPGTGFVFDRERIARLRSLTIQACSSCARCFCKYNCAGDCPAKRTLPTGAQMCRLRCDVNRRLTQAIIEEALVNASAEAYLAGTTAP